MTKQYRRGDSPVRSIGRPARRSSAPSNAARSGSPVKREPGATLESSARAVKLNRIETVMAEPLPWIGSGCTSANLNVSFAKARR